MHTLLNRIQAGDEQAVQDLFDTHATSIRRLARRHLGNAADADEVVQDVMWAVVRRAGTFRGDAKLATWIHRIAFNATMTRLRRSLRHRDIDQTLDVGGPAWRKPPCVEPPLVEFRLQDDQLRQRVATALRALPGVYRSAVVLRDVQGLSTAEAGARLSVNSATLKSRLHRGRVMLRRALADLASDLGIQEQRT